MDDEAFDDFAIECSEETYKIPSSWTKTTMLIKYSTTHENVDMHVYYPKSLYMKYFLKLKL